MQREIHVLILVVLRNYIWTLNGATLDLYHQDVTITGDGITIENAHFDRAGSYQCQASNMYGTSLSQLFTLELAGEFFTF